MNARTAPCVVNPTAAGPANRRGHPGGIHERVTSLVGGNTCVTTATRPTGNGAALIEADDEPPERTEPSFASEGSDVDVEPLDADDRPQAGCRRPPARRLDAAEH